MKGTFSLVGGLALSGLTAVVISLGGAAPSVSDEASAPIVNDEIDRGAGAVVLAKRNVSTIFSARKAGRYEPRSLRGT